MVLSKYAFRDSQDLHDIVKIRIRGGQEPLDIANVRIPAQPGTIRHCRSMSRPHDIAKVCLWVSQDLHSLRSLACALASAISSRTEPSGKMWWPSYGCTGDQAMA